MPDITITNVYNYPSSIIHLSSLKNKLIIFDFIATSCGPCIKELPRIDSLQKQYGDKVQIILVSSENSKRVQAFLKNNEYLHLPFAANDSLIRRLFPHIYISHVAWINPKRVVNGITHTEYINAKNIEVSLHGHIENWPVKQDIMDYDFSEPLWQLNKSKFPNRPLTVKHYNSAIIGYLPGVQTYNKVTIDSINNTTSFSLINFSILDLYRILYERFHLPLSFIKLNVKNTENLIYQPGSQYFQNWKSNNMYCLEASFPADITIAKQKEKLIEDVSFYFGLKANLEKRITDCLIFRYKQQKVLSENPDSLATGLTVGQIAYLLNNKLGGLPVLDETKEVHLKIPITETQVSDSSILRKVLNKFSIELSMEKREIELMVINDTSGEFQPINNFKNANK